MADPSYVLTKETLDVDEFLCDVSMHLRRREMRMLLSYIGLSGKDIDSLLYENTPTTGTERGLLTTQGTVIEGSSSVNFLDQRKRSMHTWWEYAANTRLRNTPSQQKMKVVESSTCSLPQIPEDKRKSDNEETSERTIDKLSDVTSFPPLLPAPIRKYFEDRPPVDHSEPNPVIVVDSKAGNDSGNNVTANPPREIPGKVPTANEEGFIPRTTTSTLTTQLPVSRQGTAKSDTSVKSSIPVVQMPLMETDSDELSTSQKSAQNPSNIDEINDQGMADKSQQTDLIGCDVTTDQVAIFGSSVTLEELLRKLWRSLQACGLNRVVDDLQQRWMIRIDVNQGRADMYPKMTWGTPLPPQTPFTYPPYKKIGHMAVMGSTMSIEAKPVGDASTEMSHRLSRYENGSVLTTSRSLPSEPAKAPKFLPNAIRERFKTRSARSRGLTSVSLDGSPVTSFPTRDAWKLRTDTVRRKGATVTIHITVDDVTLPPQPSSAWGSSLHVTPHQIRERVARVFLSHAMQDSRNLCRAVDRIERIRGLVVESALKRIGGGGSGIDITSSELVLQCRCLHPETVEQLWLLYQSGQLRETVQAGLVTKRAQHACAVESLRMRVVVVEEEYRRALGLLRRRPMPNTKTGRFYVTSGTGGAVGGASGLAHAQKQALMSVTRYMKLPEPTPTFQAPPPGPPGTSLAYNSERQVAQKNIRFESKSKCAGNLVHKVLSKELDSMRERLRMCEDTWCDFAANQFTNMLTCARHVMQRRIVGATAKNQLTPRCTSLSMFLALYKCIKSPNTSSTVASPRAHHATPISGNHSNIALYPSDVTFSHVDLVTTVDDDDDVVKARKKEERQFVEGYLLFSDLLAELGSCRSILQDRIVARLTTNPTVAPSKHLYLAKDIYNLMERWRHLLARDFNFAHDETVQRFSSRILSNDIVTSSFDKEIQEQFPGIVGLLPMMFHISEQIMFKLRELLPRDKLSTPSLYPALPTPRSGAIQSRHLSIWLSA